MSPRCNCNKGNRECPTPYTCGHYFIDSLFVDVSGDKFDQAPWERQNRIKRNIVIAIGLALAATTTAIFYFK
jgi:hypothetical protein